MSNTNTGGPAFPAPTTKPLENYYPGMTLRDYFAAKAMQAMFTGAVIEAITMDQDIDCDKAAKTAYAMADSMIDARQA